MNSLSILKHYRDQIQCPIVKEFFDSLDKKSELLVKINNLECAILQKYPLLRDVNSYQQDDPINGEYVYYINNKHQSVVES